MKHYIFLLFILLMPLTSWATLVLPEPEDLKSFRWEKMNRSQALEYLEKTTDFAAAQVLRENDPFSVHAQSLSDQIFLKVAEDYQKQMKSNLEDVIPKPMVFVYDGPNFVNNGAVIPACLTWDLPTQIRGENETDEYSGAVKFDSYLQSFNGAGSQECRKGNMEELQQVTQWLSQKLDCTISIRENKVEISESCRKGEGNGGIYEGFSFLTSMPVLLISKDHFDGFEADVDMGKAVISHEMVHYLRSHINFVGGKNYFYQWPDGKMSTAMPPALAKEDTVSWLIIENVLKPFSSTSYSPFPEFEGTQLAPNMNGQILAALVYYKNPEIKVESFCGENSNCKKSCSQLDQYMASQSEALGVLLDQIESGEGFDVDQATNLILTTEAKAVACFKELDMHKTLNEAVNKNVNGLALVTTLLNEPIEQQVIERAIGEDPEDEDATIKSILDYFEGKSLYEYVLWLDKKYRNFNDGILSNLKKLTSRHVGYYTGEEEADVLSLVLAKMAGWETQKLIDQIAEKIRSMGQSLKRFGVVGAPLKECVKAYDNDWKDTMGKPYWPPIGTLLNLHHDPCYRLMRMDLTNKSLNQQ